MVPTALLFAAATALLEAPSLDLTALLAEADRVQQQDIAAWSRFRFERHLFKEYLDADGRTSGTLALDFIVTPNAVAFDELLVQRDGRPPTEGEVRSARRDAKFSKHYATLVGGDAEDDEEGAYSLGVLFRLASYELAGTESIDGVPCHRIDFSPDPSKGSSGTSGRFAEAMKGSLWVTVDGLHLLRARAATVRPISMAMSLGKMYELELSMDAGSVAPGVYLPRLVEMRTNARILFKSIRQRNTYTYSGFVPMDARTAGR